MDVNNNFNQNTNTENTVNNAQQTNNFNGAAQNNFNNAGNVNPQFNNQYQQPSSSSMNPKTVGIISYITWIGFIVALLAGDRNDPYVKFHINQALVLNLFSLLSVVPFVGTIWGIFVFAMWVLAVVGACSGETRAVPLFGEIHILK
ncbi:MAG: hypothetical protein IJV29_09635 [Butyrivibrio sp.]|nr:hypothetical protein [Butyrivibrio sp.]